MPQRRWQFEASDGQHLVEPFEKAGGDAGRLLVEPAGEIVQEPLRFIGIIKLSGADWWRTRPAGPCEQRSRALDIISGASCDLAFWFAAIRARTCSFVNTASDRVANLQWAGLRSKL